MLLLKKKKKLVHKNNIQINIENQDNYREWIIDDIETENFYIRSYKNEIKELKNQINI